MKYIIVLSFLISLAACNQGEKIPDVSNIKIQLSTQRFEKDFFQLDSLHFAAALDQLQANYPSFGENFLTTILNVDPQWSADSISNYVRGFEKAYQPIYDSSEQVFKDFTPYEAAIKKGLQFVKYYFPKYQTPEKIITYIGPADGFGDILSDDAIIIGLHHHLGNQFSLYKSSLVQQVYPDYINRFFDPAHIAVNCMKNIVLDLYPERMDDKTLVQQMIEKGKRLYLLQHFLPNTQEYMLIGYSNEQMKGCNKNEKAIWDLFIKNNLLQSIDNNLIKNYIGDSPKTQELADEEGQFAPGNIGSFAGWQIVKKYMHKNPTISLPQLMGMDNDVIFNEAKYKP